VSGLCMIEPFPQDYDGHYPFRLGKDQRRYLLTDCPEYQLITTRDRALEICERRRWRMNRHDLKIVSLYSTMTEKQQKAIHVARLVKFSKPPYHYVEGTSGVAVTTNVPIGRGRSRLGCQVHTNPDAARYEAAQAFC
jgi:hypothetical protein